MSTNATKFTAIRRAATDAERQVEEFDLADVLTPDASVTISTDRKGHVNGVNVEVNGIVDITASTAIVSAAAIAIGTLIAECRPPHDVYRPGRILSSAGALLTTGSFKIVAATGVVTFVPDTAANAAAHNKVQVEGVNFMLDTMDTTAIA